jgi:hypothetical protein
LVFHIAADDNLAIQFGKIGDFPPDIFGFLAFNDVFQRIVIIRDIKNHVAAYSRLIVLFAQHVIKPAVEHGNKPALHILDNPPFDRKVSGQERFPAPNPARLDAAAFIAGLPTTENQYAVRVLFFAFFPPEKYIQLNSPHKVVKRNDRFTAFVYYTAISIKKVDKGHDSE